MTLTDFAAKIRGELILPEHSSYDSAREVWNGMIDRRPRAIVRARGVADVMATVKFVQAEGLQLAVRGGGHNVAGNGTCDDGIVLDLGLMRSVHVDPVRNTARVEGGATWRDFDHETQAHGLATPGGLVSSTGVGGLTLGGGFGYLSRMYGMVSDNLISVDAVTAEGQLRIATADENSDLFWGLRGGGGNFGVATSLKFRLHPVSTIYGGVLAFPLEMARQVFRRYRDVAENAPDELTIYAAIVPTPAGYVTGVVVGYVGSEADGRRAIQPIRDLGSLLMDTVTLKPYCEMQQIQDAAYPKGIRNYWKTSYLKNLDDAAIDVILEAMSSPPSPMCHVIIEQFGGAIARLPEDATAFEHRNAKYNIMILGLSHSAADDEPNRAWARQIWGLIQPFATGGAYVNYLDADEDPGRAYHGATYAKLKALKAKYDPKNLFRLNQNIKPV
jgi:FAD/FMN-containing dehydrogenase